MTGDGNQGDPGQAGDLGQEIAKELEQKAQTMERELIYHTPKFLVVPTEQDLDVMAKTILGEARGEPTLGQVAVAWVIINRALRRKRSITGVCLQRLQFSCWNVGDPNRARIENAETSDPKYVRALGLACLALTGDFDDLTDGADHYHTVSRPPKVNRWPPVWAPSMTETIVIGRHRFLRS